MSSDVATTPSPAVKHVFVSYHWNDQPVAIQVTEDLKKRGYVTWLDIERTGENNGLLENISEALSNAFVIVSILSSSYNHSNNCRKELELAKELEPVTGSKLHIIPVLAESGFKASPWLDFFINGLSLYQSDDYSGIAKKLWSYRDLVNKPEPKQDSEGRETAEEGLTTQELIDWVTTQQNISDQDAEACRRFNRLADELAHEEQRKLYVKDVLPAISRLLQGSINRNPRITKSLLRSLLHYGLDNSQAAVLRGIISEQFQAALDKIIAMAGISEAWEACAGLARDMQYISTTGSLDSGKKKVMISYHWDAKVLANKMFDFFKLHAANWEVVDVENMSGGAGAGLEKCAAAIASCSAVLVIVSRGYETSVSCKSELMAAKKWNKPIIFILPDQSYNGGHSWLGFASRDELSYEIHDPTMLEGKLSEIVKTGFAKVERGNIQPSYNAGSMQGTCVVDFGSVRKLPTVSMQTTDDVKQWLEGTVGLSPESSLYSIVDEEGIDGQCIRALAGMSVVDLKAFLRLSKLSDVLKLKASLEDLY